MDSTGSLLLFKMVYRVQVGFSGFYQGHVCLYVFLWVREKSSGGFSGFEVFGFIVCWSRYHTNGNCDFEEFDCLLSSKRYHSGCKQFKTLIC